MIHSELDEPPITRSTGRELRQFASLCVLVFGSLCLLSVTKHGGWPGLRGALAGAIALFLGVPGLIWPGWIRPVYLAAITLTRPIGHIVGFVVLAIVYFGLITPIGLIFRLRGRDPLSLRQIRRPSHWAPRSQSRDVRRYLRQYQPSSPSSNDPAISAGDSTEAAGLAIETPSSAMDSDGATHDRSRPRS